MAGPLLPAAHSEAAGEIDTLLALHPKGFDLSLERITRLLARLGNPQDRLPPIIHIAGTNGKGSATAFTRAILEADGHAVHVHTSPHLVHWHERYRIGVKGGRGTLVEDAVLADAVRRVAAANDGQSITVFEILTAVTFLLFAEHPADVVVLEVGLGGRFDATNVITKPAVSVIMPISLDHQAFLGDRVELIAAEKAGIMKRGCPVVIGAQEDEGARAVLIEAAERLACPYTVYGQDFLAYEEFGRLIYQDEFGLSDLPLPACPGATNMPMPPPPSAPSRRPACSRAMRRSKRVLSPSSGPAACSGYRRGGSRAWHPSTRKSGSMAAIIPAQGRWWRRRWSEWKSATRARSSSSSA